MSPEVEFVPATNGIEWAHECLEGLTRSSLPRVLYRASWTAKGLTIAEAIHCGRCRTVGRWREDEWLDGGGDGQPWALLGADAAPDA